jgi:hypothetical protein
MKIQTRNHEITIAQLGKQFIATIIRNEIVSYVGGNIPAKMVAINWFTNEDEAYKWASSEVKNHN